MWALLANKLPLHFGEVKMLAFAWYLANRFYVVLFSELMAHTFSIVTLGSKFIKIGQVPKTAGQAY